MYCTFVIRLYYLMFLTVFENHMLMFKSTPWDVIYYKLKWLITEAFFVYIQDTKIIKISTCPAVHRV